jgi:predicted Zn finger-like uncharacterized protein
MAHRAGTLGRGMLGHPPRAWMIVTCPQCQTRFRIPDERVTAKGVKVRCTRCRHTFRVSRPADAEETAGSPKDPFAQFSPSDALSERDKTPARGISVADALGVVEVEPSGAPPADDFDVDVETPEAKRKEAEGWAFPPPPPRAPETPPPLPDASEPPDAPTPRVALGRISMVRQLTVVPARTAAKTAAKEEAAPLDAPPDDPLELDTGSPHSAWQGSLEGGLELPAAPESAEFDFGDLNLDMTAVPAAPAPAPTSPPAGQAAESLDFDEMQSPLAPMPVRAPPSAPPARSFGELGGPPPPARSPRGPDASELEFASAPSPTTPVPGTDSKTPTSELFGKSATPLDEESFPLGPSSNDASRAADRATLFDMPERLAPPEEEEATAVPAGPTSLLADVPDAVPDAPVHPSAGLPAVPTTTLGRVSRPPTGTSVLGLEEPRELGRARRVSGAVVNIGVAALLVVALAAVGNVYVNEGRLDWAALSPGRWAALFVPPSGIATFDVSNGLYETRGGRPLAYVRGRVENRGLRPGRVVVHAEIWDGSQLLEKSEGLAGVLPTPEEMVEASTRRDVEALRARLQQGAPAVPPGKAMDFVLLFDEPPQGVAGLRLKVSAAAVDGR